MGHAGTCLQPPPHPPEPPSPPQPTHLNLLHHPHPRNFLHPHLHSSCTQSAPAAATQHPFYARPLVCPQGECSFSTALDTVHRYMKDMIFTKSTDEVAVAFYNSVR